MNFLCSFLKLMVGTFPLTEKREKFKSNSDEEYSKGQEEQSFLI